MKVLYFYIQEVQFCVIHFISYSLFPAELVKQNSTFFSEILKLLDTKKICYYNISTSLLEHSFMVKSYGVGGVMW